MTCDKTYALGVNFVTLNSYLCAEINAHALINLLVVLHDKPHLFKPWLFSSQPCECLFRTLRSFSSMNSTQVNFTLKDLFCRCKRVDACIRLTAQGVEDGIEYPREKRAFDSRFVQDFEFTMPTLEQIEVTVLRAQRDAEKELITLGRLSVIFI